MRDSRFQSRSDAAVDGHIAVVVFAVAMNEFAAHGLDEDAFGEKRSAGLRSFDAFRKLDLSNSLFLLFHRLLMVRGKNNNKQPKPNQATPRRPDAVDNGQFSSWSSARC